MGACEKPGIQKLKISICPPSPQYGLVPPNLLLQFTVGNQAVGHLIGTPFVFYFLLAIFFSLKVEAYVGWKDIQFNINIENIN
jgi:hypothetical protein